MHSLAVLTQHLLLGPPDPGVLSCFLLPNLGSPGFPRVKSAVLKGSSSKELRQTLESRKPRGQNSKVEPVDVATGIIWAVTPTDTVPWAFSSGTNSRVLFLCVNLCKGVKECMNMYECYDLSLPMWS